jgi:O-succinylbenzoate synthase
VAEDLFFSMKLQSASLYPYQTEFKNRTRLGGLVNIVSKEGKEGWGDIAPLPHFSKETLEQSINQWVVKKQAILNMDWTESNYLNELAKLSLYPSVCFGLESALLALLAPLPAFSISTSALLMGSPKEILEQARLRHSEGFTSAKLKVSNLSFEEAYSLIQQLKDTFYLRIDVNRAWDTEDSLRFFSQFPKDAFDYIEEPFKNPKELAQFQHPLAIDESFEDLSLEELEKLPTLKALIYKPTLQGGLLGCMPLHKWALKRGVSLVLSSSFESDIGLGAIASIAHRLSLSAPIGIGTYHHMAEHLCSCLKFSQAHVQIPAFLYPELFTNQGSSV